MNVVESFLNTDHQRRIHFLGGLNRLLYFSQVMADRIDTCVECDLDIFAILFLYQYQI